MGAPPYRPNPLQGMFTGRGAATGLPGAPRRRSIFYRPPDVMPEEPLPAQPESALETGWRVATSRIPAIERAARRLSERIGLTTGDPGRPFVGEGSEAGALAPGGESYNTLPGQFRAGMRGAMQGLIEEAVPDLTTPLDIATIPAALPTRALRGLGRAGSALYTGARAIETLGGAGLAVEGARDVYEGTREAVGGDVTGGLARAGGGLFRGGMGALMAHGPRTLGPASNNPIDVAAARLREMQVRPAMEAAAEAAAFRAPEEPFQIPTDRPFDVFPFDAPTQPAYQPPGAFVDPLAEREFLRPDPEAVINAAQARLARQDRAMRSRPPFPPEASGLVLPPDQPLTLPPTGAFTMPEDFPIPESLVDEALAEAMPAGADPRLAAGLPRMAGPGADQVMFSPRAAAAAAEQGVRVEPRDEPARAIADRDIAEARRLGARIQDVPDDELRARRAFYKSRGFRDSFRAVEEEIGRRLEAAGPRPAEPSALAPPSNRPAPPPPSTPRLEPGAPVDVTPSSEVLAANAPRADIARVVDEAVPAAIKALSETGGDRGAKVFSGTDFVTTLAPGMHPAKVEFGLENLPEGAATIAKALKRDKGNPLEMRAKAAMAEHFDRTMDEPGVGDRRSDIVPDRRQEAVPVEVDRRVAERRAVLLQEDPSLPEQAADRIARAELRAEEAESAAVTDPLTGLKNKRGWEAAVETVDPFEDHVAAIDLRGFKPVNDKYGHAAGDLVLKKAGELVRKHLGDEAARPGGDEFGAILRGLNAEEAAARIEAFRADLKALTVQVQMPDGILVDIPGLEAHIGLGRDAHEADLASNAARDRVGSGRTAAEAPPAEPANPRQGEPVEGAPGRAGEGREDRDPELGAAAPAGAVPFVVTKQTRQQLYDLGYTRGDVDAMAPAEALRRAEDMVGPGAAQPRYAVKPSPGQRGLTGIAEDVPPAAARPKRPDPEAVIEPEPLKPGQRYYNGNLVEYTGRTQRVGNADFYELRYLEGHRQGSTRLTQEPPEKYAVKPAPGQRGLPGISDDVEARAPKPKGPTQTAMFGGEMLHGTEARVTEGKETEGPLFQQERDADVRADAARQASILPSDAKPARTIADVEADLESLSAPARARREAAKDDSVKAMRPTDTDWMEPEEFERYQKLQEELAPLLKADRSAAGERVAAKRTARQADATAPGPARVDEDGVRIVEGTFPMTRGKVRAESDGIASNWHETEAAARADLESMKAGRARAAQGAKDEAAAIERAKMGEATDADVRLLVAGRREITRPQVQSLLRALGIRGKEGEQLARRMPSRIGRSGDYMSEPDEVIRRAAAHLKERAAAEEAKGLFGSEEQAADEGIADFGEKIGGARKDTAHPLGQRSRQEKPADTRPAWQRQYRVFQDERDLQRLGPDGAPWRIARGDRIVYRNASESTFRTRAEAEAALPLMEVSRNHRIHGADGGTFAIVRMVTDRKRAPVRTGFDSYEAAQKYMAAHPEEIISHKFDFPDKPWLDHIERHGPSTRSGDVRPKQFQETFGFRGGEFGNWNMGSDGQAALNHAYDALMDLSRAVGVPPKALSLNGELAIAFGARGHGGKDSARAHYEPDKAVINLTKIKGAGSLAHEWFHAVDHYLAKQAGAGRLESLSRGFPRDAKTRPELRAAFERVMKEILSAEKTAAVDGGQAAKFADRMSQGVERILGQIRSGFTYEPYNKRQRMPTAEELARFDEIAERIKAGDVGPRKVIDGQNRLSYRASYEPIEELNALYKSVRGRSFATADQGSQGRNLTAQIDSMLVARKRVESAKGGAQETKRGPSEYLRHAREIDQYRASDYWSEPHELAARAFESYAYDKLRAGAEKSDYLTHGVENRFYAAMGMKPYPEGAEREALNAAFDDLFKAIKTRETERGVELYRATDRPGAGAISAANIRAAFPTGKVTGRDGGFLVELPGQRRIRVDVRGEVAYQAGAFEAAYGRSLREGEERVVGSWTALDRAGIIQLAKEGADQGTVHHEAFHAAMDLALTPGERAAVLKKYGNEEAAAEAYAAWSPKTPDGLFGRIRAFFRRLYRAFVPDAESAFARVRSGEAFGTPDRPVPATSPEAVATAAARVEENPTAGQKDAGNYRQGHVRLQGLEITIETPKGGTRTAKDGSWKVEDYPAHYGYLKGTEGKDGDHVDVFVGEALDSDRVWVIDQKSPKTDRFDEHKALLGFPDQETAVRTYKSAYTKGLGDKLVGAVTEMGLEDFKRWARDGDTTKPLGGSAPKYATAPAQPPRVRPIPPGTPPGGAPPQATAPGGPAPAAQGRFALPEEDLGDRLVRYFQDRFIRGKKTLEAVKAQGGKVDEANDFYRAEELFHGRTEERLRDADRSFAEPLVQGLSREGLTVQQLDDYLYARHAPHRNRLIEQRTDGKVKDGSGMTDAEATKILTDLAGKGLTPKLDRMAKLVRAARDEQIRVLLDGDLISKEQAQAWRDAMGDDYVPLRSVEVDEGPGTGQGFDVRGKEAQHATGRRGRADSPTTFLLAQLQRAIVRAEKNKVAQTFAQFVRDNPDPTLWEVDKAHTTKTLDAKGKVAEQQDFRAYLDDYDFKEGGEQRRITIHDPLLRRAMKNLGAAETGEFLRKVGAFTRLYSSLVTSYSPEFILTNPVRDIQAAMANVSAEQGHKVAGQMVRNVPAAAKGLLQLLRDPKATGKWADLAREFRQDGGSVGFYSTKDVPVLEKEFQSRVAAAGPGGVAAARRALQAVGSVVEDVNKAMENASRLAVYAAMRDSGASRSKAASVAKNVTVNFNRKGEAGPAINALYAFFNANLQGTKRLKEVAIDNPRGRKIAAAVVGMGASLDLYNRSVAGDSNDDGTNDYDDIPEYVKERNLVLMREDGKPLLIPMPYGFNVLASAGRLGAALTQGAVTPAKAAVGVGSSLVNAFNPLGGEDDLVQVLAPTALDPIVQDVTNKDFAGKPIRPETFPGAPRKPNSEMFFRNVSPLARDIARLLNRATGGDRVSPGYVSVSPETIQHYFTFASGGIGRFASNALTTAAQLTGEEPLSVRNVPVARRFVYEPHAGQAGQKFRENVQELEDLWGRYKAYRQAGEVQKAKEIPPELLRAKRMLDGIETRIRALRRAMSSNPGTEKQIEDLHNRANRIVASARRATQPRPEA